MMQSLPKNPSVPGPEYFADVWRKVTNNFHTIELRFILCPEGRIKVKVLALASP
jgi:hypothetical protein